MRRSAVAEKAHDALYWSKIMEVISMQQQTMIVCEIVLISVPVCDSDGQML